MGFKWAAHKAWYGQHIWDPYKSRLHSPHGLAIRAYHTQATLKNMKHYVIVFFVYAPLYFHYAHPNSDDFEWFWYYIFSLRPSIFWRFFMVLVLYIFITPIHILTIFLWFWYYIFSSRPSIFWWFFYRFGTIYFHYTHPYSDDFGTIYFHYAHPYSDDFWSFW